MRRVHPEERIYTFWNYWRSAFERDAGLRIDHLLLSPPLAPRPAAAGVDRFAMAWDTTSDHARRGSSIGRANRDIQLDPKQHFAIPAR